MQMRSMSRSMKSATFSTSTSVSVWLIAMALKFIRFPRSGLFSPPLNSRLLQSLPSMKDRYLNKQCFQIAFSEVTVCFDANTLTASTIACSYSPYFYRTSWRMRASLRSIREFLFIDVPYGIGNCHQSEGRVFASSFRESSSDCHQRSQRYALHTP